MQKKKLIMALLPLFLCLALLITSSYAWLTMSQAPEITGIDTKIGAGGSLEIALLTDATYIDPSLIQTLVGSSSEIQKATVSNISWGNIVDLSDESYGLAKAILLPSRLNVGADGVVSNNMLSVATYKMDGRLDGFNSDTVSATYNDSTFTYYTAAQSYGVRAIGPTSAMTPQQSALAGARSAVRSYMSAAKSAGESVWKANGALLLDIYRNKYFEGSDSFTNADVAAIRDTATRTTGVLSYIDSALRQGIVGYASSVVEDTDTFKSLKSTVENSTLPLSMILGAVSVDLPADFDVWIKTVEDGKAAMRRVILGCDALSGENYPWSKISPLLAELFNAEGIYLNDKLLTNSEAYSSMIGDNELALTPSAGVFARIADFVGNIDVFFNASADESIEVITYSSTNPPYLTQISDILANKNAAAGDGTLSSAELDSVYGYAMDFAFRCNAESDLLLQTSAIDRVDEPEDEEIPSATQGGGSYMRFTSDKLNTEQMLMMMDAIRIAFLDNQSRIVGVAKPNTSNYIEDEDGISAYLYLYDYSVSSDGSMSIGERRDEDNSVIHLQRSVATVITAVVWLDGDHVDNSTTSISPNSMTGVLNLQFASSADLVSADIEIQN